MKKLRWLSALCALGLLVPLASCDKENIDAVEEVSDSNEASDANDASDFKYNIYKSGVAEGAITEMSYEEWLESIRGKDGVTPTISIDEDGYWVINGTKTNILAKAINGSSVTIGADDNWYIDGKSTGIKAKAKDGEKWYFGDSVNKEYSAVKEYNIDDLFLDTSTMKVYKYVKTYLINDHDYRYYWSFIANLSPKAKTVTVSFDADIPEIMYEYQDKYATIPAKTINKGDWLDLNTFAKEKELNKYFLGWFAGEGVDETKITSYTSISSDCVLKAKWDYEKIENEYTTPGMDFRYDDIDKAYSVDFYHSKIASNVKKVHIARTYNGKPINCVRMLNYLPSNVESVSVGPNTNVMGGRTQLSIEEEAHNYSLKEFTWRGESDKEVIIYPLAFLHCCALEGITLPTTVTNLQGCCFYGCTSLNEIYSYSVHIIGPNAFYDCTNLKLACFPNLTKIEENAFYNCSSLKTTNSFGINRDLEADEWAGVFGFDIFDSLESIGKNAFYGCTSLTVMTIQSEKILNLKDNDSCLFSYVKSIAKSPDLQLNEDSYILTSGVFYYKKASMNITPVREYYCRKEE